MHCGVSAGFILLCAGLFLDAIVEQKREWREPQGIHPLPMRLKANRIRYYAALEAADRSVDKREDVSALTALIDRCFEDQLADADLLIRDVEQT
jgi:hypothetical protein